jgi:hypothetical protein
MTLSEKQDFVTLSSDEINITDAWHQKRLMITWLLLWMRSSKMMYCLSAG